MIFSIFTYWSAHLCTTVSHLHGPLLGIFLTPLRLHLSKARSFLKAVLVIQSLPCGVCWLAGRVLFLSPYFWCYCRPAAGRVLSKALGEQKKQEAGASARCAKGANVMEAAQLSRVQGHSGAHEGE